MKKKAAAAETNNNQGFLEHKKKRIWIDKMFGYNINCFMLYPRSLYITWGSHEDYWSWNCYKETSDDNIEVVKLKAVCWLDVKGKFKISDLSPGVVYEVVYVVKLTKSAFGWEFPILLTLSLPDGKVQKRQACLLEKPRGQWFELSLGNFLTDSNAHNINNINGDTREVCFDLTEHESQWKSGLIIKDAILRPKY